MKKFFLIVFLPIFVFAQSDKNPCETLSKINILIQENHYKPKPIDDSLSVYVFKTFLDKLDEDHRLFLEPEIEKLKVHQYKIDDYIKSQNCSFLSDFFAAYNNSVARYIKIIASLKSEPLPTGSDEKIMFSKNAFPYVNGESELKKIYLKRILFNILREVADTSSNKDSLEGNFENLMAQTRTKVFDRYECKIQSYQLSNTDFNALFYSVFCSYFDPHTEYFSESEKSTFLSSVSSDNLTFGLYISMTEKDEMTVDDVIPGSSAYLSEKIDKGDQLLKIKANDEEYAIECASLKKIDEIISSNEPKVADFTFRKKSGEIYSVRLEKNVMKDYQNDVFSYKIIKDGSTFGYIKIPSFYSTFENGKSNVSDDVAREINKLKQDNVDGLIIDLENNGGGSMQEAIRLSGLFINSGPLAILRDNKNDLEIIRGPRHRNIYEGPVVIMINGLSASASEFFTNAMQDYNRAIVVGNTSLGKATMQRIFPLDENNTEFLKLTLDAFYRVTGKSNQYNGTVPDVEIPSLFDKQMPRENSDKKAIKNDQINIAIKYKPFPNKLYEQSISLSKKRIESSREAQVITDLNTKISPFFDIDLPSITLKFDSVFYEIKKMNKLWKEIEKESEKEFPITVEQNSADLKNQSFDAYFVSFNNERIKTIRQNYHILESANILNDISHLK